LLILAFATPALIATATTPNKNHGPTSPLVVARGPRCGRNTRTNPGPQWRSVC
jgi:hypothetical protein